VLDIRQKVRNNTFRVEFLCLNSKESIRCIYLTTKFGVRQHPVPKNNMIFNFPSFIRHINKLYKTKTNNEKHVYNVNNKQ
jgi:hypothetical protein